MEDLIFLERQVGAFCGEHALNNLFQEKKFYSDRFNKNTLINVDGLFNLQSFCEYLTKDRGDGSNLLGGEPCTYASGDYSYESIFASLEWFGFNCSIIDIEHPMENSRDMEHGEYSYEKLSEHIRQDSLLGLIIRHSNPDHYVAVIKKDEDLFIPLESRSSIKMTKTGSEIVEFIQGNQEWPNGFSLIKQIICVHITPSSYKCISSKNKPLEGNDKAFGNYYKERLEHLTLLANHGEKEAVCIVDGCDFFGTKEFPDFCSSHYKKYQKYILEGYKPITAKELVLLDTNSSTSTTKSKSNSNSNSNSNSKSKSNSNSKSNRKSKSKSKSNSGKKTKKCKKQIKKSYISRIKKIENGDTLCMARIYADGCGLPCNNRAKPPHQFCGIHKNQPYGRIDEDRPQGNWLKDSLLREDMDPETGVPIPYDNNEEPIFVDSISDNSHSKTAEQNDTVSVNSSSSSGVEAEVFFYQGKEYYLVIGTGLLYQEDSNGEHTEVGIKIGEEVTIY